MVVAADRGQNRTSDVASPSSSSETTRPSCSNDIARHASTARQDPMCKNGVSRTPNALSAVLFLCHHFPCPSAAWAAQSGTRSCQHGVLRFKVWTQQHGDNMERSLPVFLSGDPLSSKYSLCGTHQYRPHSLSLLGSSLLSPTALLSVHDHATPDNSDLADADVDVPMRMALASSYLFLFLYLFLLHLPLRPPSSSSSSCTFPCTTGIHHHPWLVATNHPSPLTHHS